MTILITGGSGFIGANLCRLLTERKRSFIALDNGSTGAAKYLNDMGAYPTSGDIRDPNLMDELIRRAYAVVHLAALPGVQQSIQQPWSSFETNVLASWQILDIAACWGKHVVFASSNAVFGDGQPPYDENSPTAPVSPYGASKLAIEAYAHAYARVHDLPVTILRFGNAYGPYSTHKDSVTARFIRAALTGKPFTIYGDGTQTRDFIYAGDIAEAIMCAVDDKITGTFQIATGKETTINELSTLVCRCCVNGASESCVFAAPRPGDVVRNYSNISKARDVLGWEPHTGLERGIEQTVAWFRR